MEKDSVYINKMYTNQEEEHEQEEEEDKFKDSKIQKKHSEENEQVT